MRITLVLPVVLTVLGLLLGTSASLDAKEPGLNARVQTFKKSLRSRDPKAKARAFEILARDHVNIQMVSTSEIKVSVVVDERYGELALRALHEGFGLGRGD